MQFGVQKISPDVQIENKFHGFKRGIFRELNILTYHCVCVCVCVCVVGWLEGMESKEREEFSHHSFRVQFHEEKKKAQVLYIDD